MIVREGRGPLIITTLTAVVTQVLAGLSWALIPWLLVLLLWWIYRLPALRLMHDPLGVLSPVTGRISGVGEDTDPFRDLPVRRIRVRPPWPGITLLRYPTEGKILETYLRSGVLGRELRPVAEDDSPDCYAQCLRTDEGEEVLFAISSTWPVSRCSLDRGPGERAGQGHRAGFFYFASFVDVLVPADSRLEISAGQRVRAGHTQLARLAR